MDIILTKAVAFTTSVLSAFLIATYVIVFCLRHGIPNSISITFYMIKHHIFFSLTIWTTAVLAIPGNLVASAPHTQLYGFLSVAGLLIVGAAPRFKEIHQRRIHEFGAALAIVGSILWVAFNHPETLWMLFAFVIYKLLHLFWKDSFTKPLFAIEVVSFVTFYTAIFIKFSQL